ncbi:TIGR02444 family protein [Agrobacterium tumefaciens]|nr:TIGR02444 family protein [Agrobacterium tumefaciens]TQN54863.1 TIGR02444 family protein [Agrobacterium tumefaciens]
MAKQSAEEATLWEFMLGFYALPGISRSCLELQESHNIDVPIFLAVLRYIGSGQDFDLPALKALDGRCGEWRNTVIKPLRALRTAMKTKSQMTEDMQGWSLREEIKAIELSAEKIEIAMLEKLLAHCTSKPKNQDLGKLQTAALTMLQFYGGPISGLPPAADAIVARLVVYLGD